MKHLFAFVVFIATVGLTAQTFANTEHAEEKCKAEDKGAACAETKGAEKAHGAGEHSKLSEKMNSFLPPKMPNASVSARPAIPELVGPAFLSNANAGSVKLEWKPVEKATDYHVQVATDPNFKWLVANEKFVKGTNYEFKGAEAGKRYFWRVAAFKADNNASYTKSNFVSSAFNVK